MCASKSASSRIKCSQYLRCQIPRSPLAFRDTETRSVLGIHLEKLRLINLKRNAKLLSLAAIQPHNACGLAKPPNHE